MINITNRSYHTECKCCKMQEKLSESKPQVAERMMLHPDLTRTMPGSQLTSLILVLMNFSPFIYQLRIQLLIYDQHNLSFEMSQVLRFLTTVLKWLFGSWQFLCGLCVSICIFQASQGSLSGRHPLYHLSSSSHKNNASFVYETQATGQSIIQTTMVIWRFRQSSQFQTDATDI